MRFLKPFIIAAGLITFFSACKKDSNNIDTTPDFYFLNGDTTQFDKALILFPAADTVTYYLVISSTYLPSKSVKMTLAVDDSYRQSYNAYHGTNYQAMPSGAYTFQDTLTAGTTYDYDTIPVRFNKTFLSADNYMLPIRIISVSSFNIDTSSNVIYLHTESNKLAGIYNAAGTKTMYSGDASNGNISSINTFSLVKNVIPQNNNLAQLDYADLGPNGWMYIMGFSVDDNSFFVSPNSVIDSSVQNGSFKVLASSYNSSTHEIYIKTSYKNLSGDERIVEESLTLQ